MLKYIGILILSLSVSAYGALLSKNLCDTHELRKEICSLIKNIEHGIRYGSKPTAEIISACKLKNLEKSGFITALLSGENEGAVIQSHLKMLTDEEKERLTSFFTNLGKSSYRESELDFCREYLEYFENFEKVSEKEVKEKSLLYKKIGIICGILTAIIFL